MLCAGRYFCAVRGAVRAELRAMFRPCLWDGQSGTGAAFLTALRRGENGNEETLTTPTKQGTPSKPLHLAAVHIRLGDYLEVAESQGGGAGREVLLRPLVAFLRRAMDLVASRHTSAASHSNNSTVGLRFVVLCGRHKECAENGTCEREREGSDEDCARVLPAAHMARVSWAPTQTEGEDLALMLSCDSAVITSGTFGWWGAFLQVRGEVVAQRTPFVPEGVRHAFERQDYFPPWWTVID